MAKGKLKLPKKVMGMRIPKGVRRIGRDVIDHPLGRELIAEALVHAATGLLRHQSKTGSAARSLIEHPIQTGADAATTAGNAASGTASTLARAINGLLAYLQSRSVEAREDKPPKQRPKGRKRNAKKRKNNRFGDERTTH